MDQYEKIVGGAEDPMPIANPAPIGGASMPATAQPEGMLDLTAAQPMPENVNPFGPPDVGQEGHSIWKSEQVKAQQAEPSPIPMSEPLDNVEEAAPAAAQSLAPPPAPPVEKSPAATQVEGAAPNAAQIRLNMPEAPLTYTPVTFVMEGGNVRCLFPIVLFNDLGTCLILAVEDPPPGVALFTPSPSENLEVVVGEGANAVRYMVVSFNATFRFGQYNMMALGIRSRMDD